ncbi:MAG: pectate lyase [Opitutaceae bacterium]|nr:pectate lyase [Opitutaceae bacterium]
MAAFPAVRAESAVGRKELLRQPDAWYASNEARTIADNIVLHQSAPGGWTNWSNEGGMMQPPTPADAPNLVHASLDDGATTTQLKILARVLAAKPSPAPARAARYRASFLRGFDYLLAAQYPNGGWPHRYPAEGYHAHITFNDDTTSNVIVLLRAAVAGEPVHAWLDAPRRQRAADAVNRGIACILRCQVVVDGKKTVWGAQHDAKTLAPAAARKFEPASLCGSESVGLVRLLMDNERPSPEVIAAVQAAVAWMQAVKLTGIRVERLETPAGKDARVIADPAAPPLWARFYEIGTNRPIFAGRDAVIKYSMAEIERERRGGYGWYTERPRALLEQDYPRWAQRHLK